MNDTSTQTPEMLENVASAPESQEAPVDLDDEEDGEEED